MSRTTSFWSTGDSALGRSFLAFLLAPPLASYVYTVLTTSVLAIRDGAPFDQALTGVVLGSVLITVLGGALFAYAGMAVVGFPAWLFLRFTNLESSLSYVLAGAIGGALVGPAMPLPPLIRVSAMANGAAAGATLMVLFWTIARRRPRGAFPT